MPGPVGRSDVTGKSRLLQRRVLSRKECAVCTRDVATNDQQPNPKPFAGFPEINGRRTWAPSAIYWDFPGHFFRSRDQPSNGTDMLLDLCRCKTLTPLYPQSTTVVVWALCSNHSRVVWAHPQNTLEWFERTGPTLKALPQPRSKHYGYAQNTPLTALRTLPW